MACWGGLLRCVPNTGDTRLTPRRDRGSGEATDPHEDSELGAFLTALVPRTRMTPSTRSRLRMCTQPPLPQLPPQITFGGHPHAWWSQEELTRRLFSKRGGSQEDPTAGGRSCSVRPWRPWPPWLREPGPREGEGGGHFLDQKVKAISKSSNMKVVVPPQTKSQRATCVGSMPRV